MTTTMIRGVPVRFPFEPYELQKDYMDKVIECLQNQTNGVLESPTGTGKTLSLLCSSLAWLEVKKAQIQAQRITTYDRTFDTETKENDFLDALNKDLEGAAGSSFKPSTNNQHFVSTPIIIYASRTHSQLSQAMQELKRTEYSHMRATVLGSRDQMCIHPELKRAESNAVKTIMCQMKVKDRSCYFYNGVERKKEDPAIAATPIIDIEDIVKLGETHKFCPYYMTKELKQKADIIFMPYNYLLDNQVRKSLGVELSNNIIILDEAHNIEKICEESASMQLRSTDITLAIEEVTAVMKMLTEEIPIDFNDQEVPKDFTADELCTLKQFLLNFETAMDEVELKTNNSEGTTFGGDYIFEIFEKAGIADENVQRVLVLINKLVQFLTTVNSGPFQRKGNGLQVFSDLLTIAFTSISPVFKEKLQKCYKVHFDLEEKKKGGNDWLTKAVTKKGNGRILSYWCFSPGFGMNMLMDKGVHCVILTSGTLAPLRPLISELELNVGVRLENPHIVEGDQVCMKILTRGPDNQELNGNYQNRDNPKYLQSLGLVLVNLIRIIPEGVLIFFPSYPMMQKCQNYWQETGLWNGIIQNKPIYVEPKDKVSFNNAMNEYYAKIRDPNYKGAVFMGVCRGKVSEGLDFADANGRAVFITGLPFPPLKDPRIILKKRYLDMCNARDREFLKGDDWYTLEATRAVNQAIGRVIRHKNDYGAIILLDSRFTYPRNKANLSMWLQKHTKTAQNFGEVIRDLRTFFKNAQTRLPVTIPKPLKAISVPAQFDATVSVKKTSGFFNFSSTETTTDSDSSGSVTIHKRNVRETGNPAKKIKISITSNRPVQDSTDTDPIKEFIVLVKKLLDEEIFKIFINALTVYNTNCDYEEFEKVLDQIFIQRRNLRYLIWGLEPYIKKNHKDAFKKYCLKMN